MDKIERIVITDKNNVQVIVGKENKNPDILDSEMKQFLALLAKINAKEISIEFFKNDGDNNN